MISVQGSCILEKKKKCLALGYLKGFKKEKVKTKIKLRTQNYISVFLRVGKF